MTHNSHRAGAQHWCGGLAIGRVNVRGRRSNSSAGAACCQHGSLTPKTASVLVSVMGQLLPKLLFEKPLVIHQIYSSAEIAVGLIAPRPRVEFDFAPKLSIV